MVLAITHQDFCQTTKSAVLVLIQLGTNFHLNIVEQLHEKYARTIASWNHNQSSVVVVMWGTLRLDGSSFPINLYNASLKGSAVAE